VEVFLWVSSTQQRCPCKVSYFDGKNIIWLSFGDYHAAALTKDGRIYMMGDNTFGQLGLGSTESLNSGAPSLLYYLRNNEIIINQVECGANHTIALSKNGEVYVWGIGESGRLGLGNETDQLLPVLLFGNSEDARVEKVAAQIAVGDYSTLVLTKDNELFGFGRNEAGELGFGHNLVVNSPQRIPSLKKVKIGKIYSKFSHCAYFEYIFQ